MQCEATDAPELEILWEKREQITNEVDEKVEDEKME